MKRAIFLLWLLLGSVGLEAQNVDEQLRGIYEAAQTAYDVGRIDESRKLLTDNVKSFSGSLRQSAYRLLSLCALAEDDNTTAEDYVKLLLRENPYYSTTLEDPQRFTDMVERISGRSENTITTASSHEERLSEVPVPTTLITEQMIRDSGARNLQEVLATYVPGMNIVDCNDDINIAMRGIFSNGQEKILIMLDGHRLNSYCTNIAAPDFSISLDKLRQIEVLRGPASSLYGGVALTAVVNLITKKGADVDGVKIRAGGGNYGQLKGDIVFGKRYYDLDVLLWASLYRASGQERDTPVSESMTNYDGSKVTVGGIGRKPSYDLGLTLRWKDIMFMYDTHFSQVRSPYTISTAASPYSYERYRTYNGLHPGFATNQHHASLKYSRQLGKLTLDGNLDYDNGDLTHYQVISEDTLMGFGEMMSLDESLTKLFDEHRGMSRYINGQEQTYGAQVRGDYNYLSTDDHKGYLTFGTEFSHFQLDDVRYTIGYDYIYSTPENAVLPEVGKGNENSYNAFAQLKHQWRSFIVNAGLRYDHKVRFDDSRVNEYSPRLALIYIRPKWNVKLSYSKAFVDAPYLYQKMNQFMGYLSSYNTPDNTVIFYTRLNPETLHSTQLTFTGTQWLKGLDFELNLFYNRANDLILTEIIRQENSGKNETLGAELMASYKQGPLSAYLNATWMKTLTSSLIYKDFNDNNSTPAFTSNLTLAWQATKQLRLHTKAAFQGRQNTYNVSFIVLRQIQGLYQLIGEAYGNGDTELGDYYINVAEQAIDERLVSVLPISSRLVLSLGGEYHIGKVSLGLDIHNVLNKKYNQSGMNTGLVPQRGRWILGTIGYEF